MTAQAASWPRPNAAALAASARLETLLRERIAAASGWMSFADFMQAALFEPGLGYYSGGSAKLGPAGDFVTAPGLGDFLARALATSLAPALQASPRPRILELGAGTGELAAQLLAQLDARGVRIAEYLILETSAELRARQRAALRPYGSRIEWIDSLDGVAIDGLVVANEVADALPVERFRKTADGVRRLGVTLADRGFGWMLDAVPLADPAQALGLEPASIDAWPIGFESEYRPQLGAWVGTLADALVRGAIAIIDYGLPRRDYYRPERSAGTLMCHYRHRAHSDPFLYPGLQDITAWVDFSDCADAGRAAGLELAAFTPQGGWLLESLAAVGFDAAALTPAAVSSLKTLVLPGEMGERFKLLLLTRSTSLEVPGRDLRDRL